MPYAITLLFFMFFTPLAAAQTYVGQSAGDFRVNESGAATYNFPLSLPSGIAGVKPQVSLNYSSNGGEGYLGQGWSLSAVSAITRCPKNLTLDNEQGNVSYTDNDRLCLNGQRLISEGNNYNKTTNSYNQNITNSSYWSAASYHTEIDDFSLIRAHGNAEQGPEAFTVETKSGEVHYYGLVSAVYGVDSLGINLSLPLEVYGGGSERSDDAFVDHGNVYTAKMWALKAIKDVKGNYIVFRYHKNNETGEHYLTEIHYTGRVNGDAPYARVIFNYQDNPKPRIGWTMGAPFALTQLLKEVEVYVDNQLYRYYALNYFTSDVTEEKNYLESIEECTDLNRSDCLPPTRFTWQKPPQKNTSYQWIVDGETGERFREAVTDSFKPFSRYSSTKGRSDNRNYNQIIDLDGDGYNDIVFIKDGEWQVRFGPSYLEQENLTPIGVSQKEYALTIDYNGDGQRDLLVADSEDSNWYIISYTPSSLADTQCDVSFTKPRFCGEVSRGSVTVPYTLTNTKRKAYGLKGNAQVADVDGDGLEDIIFTRNGYLNAYINRGDGTFDYKTNIGLAPQSSGQFFNSNVIRYSTTLKEASAIDINGDGRTDLVAKTTQTSGYCQLNSNAPVEFRPEAFEPGECREAGGTWVGNRSSRYKLLVSNGTRYNVQQNLGDYDAVRALDLNGDGYTDIMYQANQRWYYRLSNGIEFLPAVRTQFSTSDELTSQLYFIDLNADGKTDILFPTSKTYWAVYLTRSQLDASRVFFSRRGEIYHDKNAAIRFGDMNGDGKLDLLTATNSSGWKVFLATRSTIKEHVISDITTGWGNNTHITYQNINKPSVYYRQDSSYNINSDYFSPKTNFYVVAKVETEITEGETVAVDYQYGGLLLHKKGRGLLGFETLKTTDKQTKITTETRYRQDWPYTGMPKSTVQTRYDVVLSVAQNSVFDTITTANGGAFPYIKQSVEQNNSLGSDGAQYDISTTTSDFSYDGYGNLMTSTITVKDSQNAGNRLETTTSNRYGSSALAKQKGRLIDTTVTKKQYKNHLVVSNISRKSQFTYYPANQGFLLKSEIIAPDDNLAKQTKTSYYNDAGQLIKESVTAASNSTGAL